MRKFKPVKGTRGRVKDRRHLEEPAFERQPKKIPKTFDGFSIYEPTTGENANERGSESERIVKEMLTYFKERKIIKGFRQTKKYSRLDMEGVDFLIFYRGNRIRLQVKSSDHGVNRFIEKNYIYQKLEIVNGRSSYLQRDLLRILERYKTTE